ncbi:MAG: hypothetical protein JNL43_04480 [Flavobacteriales bacterium]|nr:hypothetical protein [Flavobacteriales bacterium]
MDPTIVRWLPRILAVTLTAFFSLFAFDVEEGGQVRMLDLLMHLLPTLFCAAVIVFAWSREWIGMLVFFVLALVYAWWARDHVQWILVIGAPMLMLAAFYGWAWRTRQRVM